MNHAPGAGSIARPTKAHTMFSIRATSITSFLHKRNRISFKSIEPLTTDSNYPILKAWPPKQRRQSVKCGARTQSYEGKSNSSRIIFYSGWELKLQNKQPSRFWDRALTKIVQLFNKQVSQAKDSILKCYLCIMTLIFVPQFYIKHLRHRPSKRHILTSLLFVKWGWGNKIGINRSNVTCNVSHNHIPTC